LSIDKKAIKVSLLSQRQTPARIFYQSFSAKDLLREWLRLLKILGFVWCMKDLAENNLIRFTNISRKKDALHANFRVKGLKTALFLMLRFPWTSLP
jgi:hypothetical protein